MENYLWSDLECSSRVRLFTRVNDKRQTTNDQQPTTTTEFYHYHANGWIIALNNDNNTVQRLEKEDKSRPRWSC
jgi:hypothetical protein